MTNKLEISRELAKRIAIQILKPRDEGIRRAAIEELRAVLAAPVVERQDIQVAAMPVERCYDVRVKMIMAFNEAKKNDGDLDDALDAAYKSALRFSPNPLIAEQPAPVAVVPFKIIALPPSLMEHHAFDVLQDELAKVGVKVKD